MRDLKLPKISLPKLSFPLPDLAFLKRKKLSLGLDIGSHSVKICELAEIPTGYKLLSLGNARVPPGAVEDGVLQDPDAVAKIISALAKNLKVSGQKVAFSISGYSVIVKRINLAVMPPDALEKHIVAEAEQYIPFDIDDVYLDFQDLKTNTPDEYRTDVMLVAAKKDVIDAYLTMLKSAGLKTTVVDVDAFALENAFAAIFKEQEENIGLVDIGASKINLNILSRGTSILTRDIVLGSRQLTEEIGNRLGISQEDAEAIKIGAMPVGDRAKEIEDIFSNVCSQWVAEIRRAIDFYYANNPDELLAKLVLSGGGSKVQGFSQYLSKQINIPVENFNPFNNIVFDKQMINPEYLSSIGPEMAIAMGLATRPVAF